jgi:quercetin dioxygenase-like cupin family protein
MTTATATVLRKNLNAPDETREFNNGKIEFVNLEDIKIARVTLKPGWRWSKDVKPSVKSKLCPSHHLQYVISGRLMVRMEDGTEFEMRPGDCVSIAPGHDAWVLGGDPFVAIDYTGLKEYSREHMS